MTACPGRRRRGERGFTLVEVLISILLSVVALVGIMGLFRVQTTSSNFSRHQSEATALAEDTVEQLRTQQTAATTGSDTVDETGDINPSGGGMFTVTWTLTAVSGFVVGDVVVAVSWNEEGTTETVNAWGQW